MNASSPHTDSHEILVIGEALIDIVATEQGSIAHPGGSPANVAFGLGRLGVDAGLLTALGDDEFGAKIQAHLGTANVKLLPGCLNLERTASATAVLAADGSARYEFDITWDLAPHELDPMPKIVHTGSIATFLEPGAEAVASLLAQAKGQALLTYDPNIRPALVGEHGKALETFKRMAALCDVVKLSDEDARWLYPQLELEQVSDAILELGPILVVLTLGAEGALLATRSDQVRIKAVRSEVADTIGAGDSFMSSLLQGLLAHGSAELSTAELEHLGRRAVAGGALAVRRSGAMPPTLEELTALLEEQHLAAS
ncbi:carbohydrate kinase family protein [Glutamicibacter halophytocola]|uniref:Carbohydrate kinase n=1 Tax=Glutamicibacter halophytocola TaxID=1933880 RepID=A0AA94XT54_9MICC|nr:carbohydrate kinase [Glutamicibacter halophytocola]UUX58374.1 carbohydrate kinase [Glutamicibacter halophytocola]